MEAREWRTVDKSSWGDGPWASEPDKAQWKDAETGLPCLIVRNRMGALCGYVGVPTTHRLYGKEYEHADVVVHGGLTFSEACQHGENEGTGICHIPGKGEPDTVWWFGFDCAHGFDVMPAYSAKWGGDCWPGSQYRDVGYVRGEIASLARQLAALA